MKLPLRGDPVRFYSNVQQKDLRLTLLEAIHQAKTSIHLVMFGLSDTKILQELSKKQQEGVEINIYFDPKGSPKLSRELQGATLYPIKQPGLMHQKILVIDHELVFLGSANMTTSSLSMHENLLLGIFHPQIAVFLENKTPYHSGYLHTFLNGQSLDIWLLPDPRGHTLTALREKIKRAAYSLRIALFTYTHPSLIEEVIAAHARGVSVSVIVDRYSSLGASAKGIERLRREHVPVFVSQGMQLMHHKFVWIDEHTLLSGSANWTKAAFYKNSDCLFALYPLDTKQRAFMEELWGHLKKTAKALP